MIDLFLNESYIRNTWLSMIVQLDVEKSTNLLEIKEISAKVIVLDGQDCKPCNLSLQVIDSYTALFDLAFNVYLDDSRECIMEQVDEQEAALIQNLRHWTNIKVSAPSFLKDKIRKGLIKRGFQLPLDNDSRYITALNRVLLDTYVREDEENFLIL